jgi:hypothetical protein
MGAELFHGDRRTERHENLIVAFCNFAYVSESITPGVLLIEAVLTRVTQAKNTCATLYQS